MILYVGNDMILSFTGDDKLIDSEGDPITSATVTATLYEWDGKTEVGGETWPLTLNDDGNGEYSAVLQETLGVKAGSMYILVIEAEKSGANGRWYREVHAKERT